VEADAGGKVEIEVEAVEAEAEGGEVLEADGVVMPLESESDSISMTSGTDCNSDGSFTAWDDVASVLTLTDDAEHGKGVDAGSILTEEDTGDVLRERFDLASASDGGVVPRERFDFRANDVDGVRTRETEGDRDRDCWECEGCDVGRDRG